MMYNLNRYEEAQTFFEDRQQITPNCLDLVDVYSNILFIAEKRKKLSYLAHRCMQIDKYRPETACVIGNYYALYGMHEKAILYFHRALRLNPHFVSAWILMGHEYIELRNIPAALQAYRKAVDLHPNNHRAWYGLGHAYELMEMYSYAVFYLARRSRDIIVCFE